MEFITNLSRKKILITLGAVILFAAIPLTYLLTQQQQDPRSRAAEATYCGATVRTCLNPYTGSLRYPANSQCTSSERTLAWGDGGKKAPLWNGCASLYTGQIRMAQTAGVPLNCTSAEIAMSWSQGNINQPNVINGCVSIYTSRIRIPASASCTSSERLVTWATHTADQCVTPTPTPSNTPTPTNTPIPTPTHTPTPTETNVCNQQCFTDEDCAGGGNACGTCRAVEGSFEKICTTPIGGEPTPTQFPGTITPTPISNEVQIGVQISDENNSALPDTFQATTKVTHVESGEVEEQTEHAWGFNTDLNGEFLFETTNATGFTVSYAYCLTTIGASCTPWEGTFTQGNSTTVDLNAGDNIGIIFRYTSTSTPTPTQTPTPTPTLVPSVTPDPDETALELQIKMPGIGGVSGDNTSPENVIRDATINIYNTQNTIIQTLTVPVQFNGTIYTGSSTTNAPAGTYYATVRLNNTLYTVTEIFQLTHGNTTTLAQLNLIPGDLDQNNILDVRDYNIFLSCFGDKQCTQKQLSDFNDDGQVGGIDYNILIRAFEERAGS